MDLDHLLFCANHPEKIAKRHCNKCNQDVCNECVFDLHIEHHPEITKINYLIDNKSERFTYAISEEIKKIINDSLEALKPQICELVLNKTKDYINTHKNLQLKASVPVETNDKLPNYIKSERTKKLDTNKSNIRSSYNTVNNMTKIFDNKFAKEYTKKTVPDAEKGISSRTTHIYQNENKPKEEGAAAVKSYEKLEDNNPLKKGVKGKGVNDMKHIFEGNK